MNASARNSAAALASLILVAGCLMGPAIAGAADDDGAGNAATDATAELPVLESSDTDGLKAKDGQKVVVIGKCDRTGKSSGGTNFVNFAGSEFVLVTFKSDLAPFTEGEPADIYEGKYLSVTGVIGIYKDAPQIVLTDPAQVEVADEPFQLPTAELEPAPASAEGAGDADGKGPMKGGEGGEGGDDPEKPKPPVDPRKYFPKPAS